MKTIDTYSYHCGTIDCFNEMLAAGLKHISLSHPQNSAQERDDYLAFSAEICKQYGTAYYVEDSVIATDLFPLSMTDGKFVILYYKDNAYLEQYLALKQRKQALVEASAYEGEARRQLAYDFGKLLSYTEEAIMEHMENNTEKQA